MKLENKTIYAKRRYDDACGTAFALDLIGERWALLVVRELMFGPRRFGELRSGLRGISAPVLTQRLEGLEMSGIVQRRRLPPPASVQVYELTPWGNQSERAMQELGRWATRSPDHDPTLPLSAASLMMSFRTMFASGRAVGLNATIGFKFDDEAFVAMLDPQRIAIRRAEPENTAVLFESTPAAMAAIVYAGRPINDAELDASVRIIGDHRLAERFITLFPLPDKIESGRATVA